MIEATTVKLRMTLHTTQAQVYVDLTLVPIGQDEVHRDKLT